MAKILVTGATGFVGSNLVPELVKKHEVVALAASVNIGQKDFHPDVKVEHADLADYHRVKSIVARVNPSVIIHLAAIAPVRNSFVWPEIYQEVNYLATMNLVQCALKVPDFERFLYASTMEVYGWQAEHKPFKEDRPLNPASPYGVAKAAADMYVRMAGKAYGLPHVVLRNCNTYGGKRDPHVVLEYITKKMLMGESPQIGTPEAVRDFIHVDDHVSSYLSALEYPLGNIQENLRKDVNHYVFNFGWGTENNIGQMAEKIKKMVGFTGEIKYGFPSDYPNRPVVEPYLSLDSTKARTVLKWQPQVPLEEGLKRMVNHWKSAA